MAYAGDDRNDLKFHCPHVMGKVKFPHGSNWCSSSKYGMVVKVNGTDDLHKFSLSHRDTRKLEESV